MSAGRAASSPNRASTRAALERASSRRKASGTPELLMSSTGYPAFEKFAPILGYKVVRVPVGDDFRADVAGLEALAQLLIG